jgi:hypothetical protein
MATIRQINANRLNAKKSTGPRTAEGKSRSCMNALKSGVDAYAETIPTEDPAALEALAAEYIQRFHPVTPDERHLVDTLIHTDWLRRRLARAEAQMWQWGYLESAQGRESLPLGCAFECIAERLSRLQRRLDSLDRSYRNALRELERLRAVEPDPDLPSQPVENLPASPQDGVEGTSPISPDAPSGSKPVVILKSPCCESVSRRRRRVISISEAPERSFSTGSTPATTAA